jgi:glycosyltransferase involved in cell wall biosynthesis
MGMKPLPPQPLVSIVTPTFNMGRFLGETMESVLSQDYPHIEYIVMDGGSTDNTVEVLREFEGRYPGRFTWVSEKDGGQADAVNKGFQKCRGEIFTFLNSDDTYLPGAVTAAVEGFLAHPEAAVVYGDAYYTDEQNQIIKKYPVDPYDFDRLGTLCHICQPAALIRTEAYREVGMMDTNLHLTLDYDLWLKISARYPRMWADNKTLSKRRITFREVVKILKQHRGYVPVNWTFGYAAFLLDGKDGFYQVSDVTIPSVTLATAMGLWFNRTKPWKFLAECVHFAKPAVKMMLTGERPSV